MHIDLEGEKEHAKWAVIIRTAVSLMGVQEKQSF